MTKQITAPMPLKTWQVPNFAVPVAEEGNAGWGLPLGQLPQESLDELAAAWLTELYRKAGKDSPWSRS